MAYLSRNEFLSRQRRREDDYTFPDGRKVRIRELLAEEMRIANEIGQPDPETHRWLNRAGMAAFVVQRGVIDPESGEPLIAPEDIALLADARATGLWELSEVERLYGAILHLSEVGPGTFRAGDRAPDPAGNADAPGGAADRGGEGGAERPGTGAGDERTAGAAELRGTGRPARKRAARHADRAGVAAGEGAVDGAGSTAESAHDAGQAVARATAVAGAAE